MTSLLIRIAVTLEDHNLGEFGRPEGPLFHRWLPNGEADAIELRIDDKDMQLRVWFERRGFVDDHGFIVIDDRRREVDPNIMSRQARLDAGPLRGNLDIADLPEADVDVLVADSIGEQRYIDLGKRIVEGIYPPLAGLIRLLRVNYGQYWIADLAPWDSRRVSLGGYCNSRLQLSWSNDQGSTWRPFRPTAHSISIQLTPTNDSAYEKYLRRDDYLHFAEQLKGIPEPTLAATMLASAHRLLDEKDLRHAFIEAVSALELAIDQYLRSEINESEALTKAVQPFWDLSLKAKLISITARRGRVTNDDVEKAAEAIDVRNRIVHHGFFPQSNPQHVQMMLALLQVASSLLPGPEFRFPSLNTGNKLYEPDD